jgi:hypothetical protein
VLPPFREGWEKMGLPPKKKNKQKMDYLPLILPSNGKELAGTFAAPDF